MSGGQRLKQTTSEEEDSDYSDDNASFYVGYLDASTSTSLENLLAFMQNLIGSSGRFDKIQLFMPDQNDYANSDVYEITNVLAKFGIFKSEGFLLSLRTM